MADDLFKPDDIIRQWSGYDGLTEDMGIVHEAATRIVDNDDRAAGDDEYGKSYKDTRGSTALDVLDLIKGVQVRTFTTGDAGHTSAVVLDRAEEDNRRHSGFGPEHH